MKGKRLVSVFLSVVFIFGLMTVNAGAAEIENYGEIELVKWITAAAAIVNSSNSADGDYRMIDLPRDKTYTRAAKSILNGVQWNIMDADDLRDQIEALTYGGHNETFMMFYQVLNELGVDEGLNFFETVGMEGVDKKTLEVMKSIGDKWGNTGIIAWDLIRVATLASWGYMAEYIDRDEACRLMEPAVSQLKFRFTGWDDAIDNYLDGYCFWSQTDPADDNTEYVRRAALYFDLKEAYPNLFDDELFALPHIVNLKQTYAPTADFVNGYWEMVMEGERDYQAATFYFDDKGNAATLYELENPEESELLAGLYNIESNVLITVYTYLKVGEEEHTAKDDDGYDEIIAFESFVFCIAGDGEALHAIDLYSGESFTLNKVDGSHFPELPQYVPRNLR